MSVRGGRSPDAEAASEPQLRHVPGRVHKRVGDAGAVRQNAAAAGEPKRSCVRRIPHDPVDAPDARIESTVLGRQLCRCPCRRPPRSHEPHSVPCYDRRVIGRALPLAAAMALMLAAAACTGTSTPPTPVPPTATETPLFIPSATPRPAATPTPLISDGNAIVVGGDLRTRGAPTTQGPVVSDAEGPARRCRSTRRCRARTGSSARRRGCRRPRLDAHLVPAQRRHLRLRGVRLHPAARRAVAADRPAGAGEVDRRERHDADRDRDGRRHAPSTRRRVSTGAPSFPSPLGTHKIEKDGRLAVERMTAAQAGYTPGQAQYDVERVLFTQYYDRSGDALHLNYWRPKRLRTRRDQPRLRRHGVARRAVVLALRRARHARGGAPVGRAAMQTRGGLTLGFAMRPMLEVRCWRLEIRRVRGRRAHRR